MADDKLHKGDKMHWLTIINWECIVDDCNNDMLTKSIVQP